MLRAIRRSKEVIRVILIALFIIPPTAALSEDGVYDLSGGRGLPKEEGFYDLGGGPPNNRTPSRNFRKEPGEVPVKSSQTTDEAKRAVDALKSLPPEVREQLFNNMSAKDAAACRAALGQAGTNRDAAACRAALAQAGTNSASEKNSNKEIGRGQETTNSDKALSASPSGTNPKVVSPQQDGPSDVGAAQQAKAVEPLSDSFGGELRAFPTSSSENVDPRNLGNAARTVPELLEYNKDAVAPEPDLFQRHRDALTRAQQRKNVEPPPPPRQGDSGSGPNKSTVTGLGETKSLPDPGTSQKVVGTVSKNTVIPGNAADGIKSTEITNNNSGQIVKFTYNNSGQSVTFPIPNDATDGSATPSARDPSGSSSAPFVPHLTASSSPTGKVESALAPNGKSSLTMPAALPATVVVRKQQVITTAAPLRDQGVNTTYTYTPPQTAYSPPVQRSQSLNVNDAIAVMGVLTNLAVGAAAIAGARGGGGGYAAPSYNVPRVTPPTPTYTYPRATSPTPPSYNKHCMGSYVCSAQ